MRNKRVWMALTVVAVATVVLAGGLLASNMGFKLNFTLNKADGGTVSASGTNYVGLPYNPQVGITNSRDLFNDIGWENMINVQQHTRATDEFKVYTFTAGAFDLNPGEAYIVKVLEDVNYIVVGSHDPSASVTLQKADGGTTSASGTNYYAHPYHGVASTARELFTELGWENMINIQQHTRATDEFKVYTFTAGNFDLVPGEGYIVKVLENVTFTPAHY